MINPLKNTLNQTSKYGDNTKLATNQNEPKVLISVENLYKTFDKKYVSNPKMVLNNVDFQVYENTNTALLGWNGAGKTTLVEIIVGINSATKGKINYFFDSKNWQNEVGIQFQDSSYPIGLKVWEVIHFITGIYETKVSSQELEFLIKKFGITEFYTKAASSLSGGEKQRLNLLLSIINKPKVLILDEISTGLDVHMRKNIMEFMKEFSIKNKSSLVLISHDFYEIDYLCDRFVILAEGKIKTVFTRKELEAKRKTVYQHLTEIF